MVVPVKLAKKVPMVKKEIKESPEPMARMVTAAKKAKRVNKVALVLTVKKEIKAKKVKLDILAKKVPKGKQVPKVCTCMNTKSILF